MADAIAPRYQLRMSTVSDKAFQLLKADFGRLAKSGEMKKLVAYLGGDRYKTLYAQLTVKRQLDLHDHVHAAKAAATKHRKMLKPFPLYSKRGWRAWDADRIAKLREAETKHRSDEGIASEMGISYDAARRARLRYIGPRGHKPFLPYATVMREAA